MPELNANEILATWPTTADGVKYVPGLVVCDINGCQFRAKEIGVNVIARGQEMHPDDPAHDCLWQWQVYAETKFADGWGAADRMNYWNGYSTIAAARAHGLRFITEPDESLMTIKCPMNPNPTEQAPPKNNCRQ